MAEKRMFAKSIIDTDAFLGMPMTAQCLYFHLAMRADDAGFVANPNIIRRVVGSSDEDFKTLISMRYIILFSSGVVVIKHWWIHNVIKNDRKDHTTWKEELATLKLDSKNAYIERDETPVTEESVDKSEQSRNDDDSDSELSRNQLGTNSEPQKKIKESKGNETKGNISPSNGGAGDTSKSASSSSSILSKVQQSRFDAFWKVYPKKVGKQDAQKAWKKIAPDEELTDTIIRAVETAKQKDSRFREERFIPHPATWLNAGSWENEYDDYFPAQEQTKPQSGDGPRQLDVGRLLAAATRRRRTSRTHRLDSEES